MEAVLAGVEADARVMGGAGRLMVPLPLPPVPPAPPPPNMASKSSHPERRSLVLGFWEGGGLGRMGWPVPKLPAGCGGTCSTVGRGDNYGWRQLGKRRARLVSPRTEKNLSGPAPRIRGYLPVEAGLGSDLGGVAAAVADVEEVRPKSKGSAAAAGAAAALGVPLAPAQQAGAGRREKC